MAAGSPAAQKIIIARGSGIEKKRALAETIAGIKKDETFEKILGKSEEEYWAETKEKSRPAR